MYMIIPYELYETSSGVYLNCYGKGIKITDRKMASLLRALQAQHHLEVSTEDLHRLLAELDLDVRQFESILMHQIGIIKPRDSRKFNRIYLNIENQLVAQALKESLSREYEVTLVSGENCEYDRNSLVVFYRNNYSSRAYKALYDKLGEDVYLVTSGVLHKVLIIDNIYVKNSGLPTHFSNFNAFLACAQSDLSLTKNNWLLFYRALLKEKIEEFPDPNINSCQQSYISYCLYKFVSQFTQFWKAPTTLDEFKWFWHADLNSFNVFKEVAVHSPYSEYDMTLQRMPRISEEVSL